MPIASEEIIRLSVGHESILSAFIIGDIVELGRMI
jgi:hypothetical protein